MLILLSVTVYIYLLILEIIIIIYLTIGEFIFNPNDTLFIVIFAMTDLYTDVL